MVGWGKVEVVGSEWSISLVSVNGWTSFMRGWLWVRGARKYILGGRDWMGIFMGRWLRVGGGIFWIEKGR